jgi:hypothetical protein
MILIMEDDNLPKKYEFYIGYICISFNFLPKSGILKINVEPFITQTLNYFVAL